MNRLMAIVVAGDQGTSIPFPNTRGGSGCHEVQIPTWKPDAPSRGTWASNAQGRRYGFRTFGDYFTPRQLVALTTFSDLVAEAMERVKQDADVDVPAADPSLRNGGGARPDQVPLQSGLPWKRCEPDAPDMPENGQPNAKWGCRALLTTASPSMKAAVVPRRMRRQ